MEYIIKGDTEEFEDCLVLVCGASLEHAKQVLNRILTNPNDNDKKIIRCHKNLRIKEVSDEQCWWNGNCD